MKTVKAKKAQNELDRQISLYYRRNEDGGTFEEKYAIALRIAMSYGLNQAETDSLDF